MDFNDKWLLEDLKSVVKYGNATLGPNQAPPPYTIITTHENGYPTAQHQSYFHPQHHQRSTAMAHFQRSSRHNSPSSPPKYRSGLSSAYKTMKSSILIYRDQLHRLMCWDHWTHIPILGRFNKQSILPTTVRSLLLFLQSSDL